MDNDDGILPVQAIKGEPTSCTQCGSILDSAYDNMVLRLHFPHYFGKTDQSLTLSPPPQVNVCYFCQDLSNSSSLQMEALPGYRDSLFLLHPYERPLTAEPLLLFCIDVSGSMSVTLQVRAHQLMESYCFTMTSCIHKYEQFSFHFSSPQGHRKR